MPDFQSLEEGQTVEGKVDGLEDYGAFIELEPGLSGLLHISEMSWSHVGHPGEMLEVGERVRVEIIEMDEAEEQITLSRRALNMQKLDRIREDETYLGEVEAIREFGMLVSLPHGVVGVVHDSRLGTSDGQPVREFVNEGDSLMVRVADIDRDGRRVHLSTKQVLEEQERGTLRVGDRLDAEVSHLTEFGAFVDLTDNLQALLHNSEVSWDDTEAREELSEGDEIEVEIIRVDREVGEVAVSTRRLETGARDKLAIVRLIEWMTYDMDLDRLAEDFYSYKVTPKVTERTFRVQLIDLHAKSSKQARKLLGGVEGELVAIHHGKGGGVMYGETSRFMMESDYLTIAELGHGADGVPGVRVIIDPKLMRELSLERSFIEDLSV